MTATSMATLVLSSTTPGSCLITYSNGKSSPETKTNIMSLKAASFPSSLTAVNVTTKARRTISCQAVSTATMDKDEKDASVSESAEADEEANIGARVRVKVPLKVYHVPRMLEVDLTCMEGVIKQYMGLWKGKQTSANLPYKVEFVMEIEGRGPVKFFAHLKEDELEFIY